MAFFFNTYLLFISIIIKKLKILGNKYAFQPSETLQNVSFHHLSYSSCLVTKYIFQRYYLLHLTGLLDMHFHRVNRYLFTMIVCVYTQEVLLFQTELYSEYKLQLMHTPKSFLKWTIFLNCIRSVKVSLEKARKKTQEKEFLNSFQTVETFTQPSWTTKVSVQVCWFLIGPVVLVMETPQEETDTRKSPQSLLI